MQRNRLLKYATFFILNSSFLILHSASGQGGTWTWISGDSAVGSAGVFGPKGSASVNYHPPGIYDALSWKDKQGNFWIYGGTFYFNTDLWKFKPSTKEWTWVKGSGLQNDPPVYGTK